MKKKLFFCFHSHPIVLSKKHKKKGLQISGQNNKPKGPFSHVLEILLLKTSLKIKSETLQGIYKQISDDGKTRTGKGTEKANILPESEIRSSVPFSLSYDSKNTRSSTVGKCLSNLRSQPFDHKETNPVPKNRIITRPCPYKSNPGLYYVVFTLFFTVVWGKTRAILFTLVLLYLLPVLPGFLR